MGGASVGIWKVNHRGTCVPFLLEVCQPRGLPPPESTLSLLAPDLVLPAQHSAKFKLCSFAFFMRVFLEEYQRPFPKGFSVSGWTQNSPGSGLGWPGQAASPSPSTDQACSRLTRRFLRRSCGGPSQSAELALLRGSRLLGLVILTALLLGRCSWWA